MPSIFSLPGASIFLFLVHQCLFVSIRYTIFFTSLLVVLLVVTSIQFFFIFQIISSFVYDNFKIIIILIIVNVCCLFFKFVFISTHNGFCSSLSIFFSRLLFLFLLTKYFKLLGVNFFFIFSFKSSLS